MTVATILSDDATASPSRNANGASVDKAMDLLDAFGPDDWSGLGVTALARRSGLTKSTAFRVLNALERNGAVERVGNRYRLGDRMQKLGSQVYAPGQQQICDAATPFLVELYETTHRTVHLAVLHGTDVVYLQKLHGHQTVRCPSRIGRRAPAYCTAGGKVLLARNPEAVDATIALGLQRWTAKTPTTPESLMDELNAVRRIGIAFAREEAVPGLICVAAPVLGAHGRPVAAISISGNAGSYDPSKDEAVLRRVAHSATRALTARVGR
jgi:IclR family transcriptional regulator, KDG regulon repressor